MIKMLKQLKQTIVVAILLLMAVSFTIGSVSPAANTGNNGTAHFFYAGHMDGLRESGFTQVALFMPDIDAPAIGGGVETIGLRPWLPPGEIPDGMVLNVDPGHEGREFITEKMMITPPGDNMPRTLPIMFFRHQWPNDTGHVSFRADTSYRLNDTTLRFTGEIQLVNVSGSVASDAYNYDISSGQTSWHQATVTGSPTSFNFALKWNNSDDQMRIVVYTPDGKVLGPYTDSSDGITDSAINMNISNPAGVTNGQWSFKVTDTGVTGKDEYYLKTW